MTKQNINQAVKALKSKLTETWGQDIEVYLFGSAARDEAKPHSDIDLLLLIPGKVNNKLKQDVFDMAFEIELEYDVVFGIIVRSKDYWRSGIASVTPLHKNIQREGIRV